MGRLFDDLNSLNEYIMDEIQDVLENEVYDEITRIEQEVIEETVYGWGEPNAYERRYHDGGIIDGRNININEINRTKNGVSMTVTNDTTTANSSWEHLDEIIEDGVPPYAQPYSKPRPFTENTQQRVEEEDILKKALKKRFNG